MNIYPCQVCGYETVAPDAYTCPKCHTRNPINFALHAEERERALALFLGGTEEQYEEIKARRQKKSNEQSVRLLEQSERFRLNYKKEKEEERLKEIVDMKKDVASTLRFFILILVFAFIIALLPLPNSISTIKTILIFALILLGFAVLSTFFDKRKNLESRLKSGGDF